MNDGIRFGLNYTNGMAIALLCIVQLDDEIVPMSFKYASRYVAPTAALAGSGLNV